MERLSSPRQNAAAHPTTTSNNETNLTSPRWPAALPGSQASQSLVVHVRASQQIQAQDEKQHHDLVQQHDNENDKDAGIYDDDTFEDATAYDDENGNDVKGLSREHPSNQRLAHSIDELPCDSEFVPHHGPPISARTLPPPSSPSSPSSSSSSFPSSQTLSTLSSAPAHTPATGDQPLRSIWRNTAAKADSGFDGSDTPNMPQDTLPVAIAYNAAQAQRIRGLETFSAPFRSNGFTAALEMEPSTRNASNDHHHHHKSADGEDNNRGNGIHPVVSRRDLHSSHDADEDGNLPANVHALPTRVRELETSLSMARHAHETLAKENESLRQDREVYEGQLTQLREALERAQMMERGRSQTVARELMARDTELDAHVRESGQLLEELRVAQQENALLRDCAATADARVQMLVRSLKELEAKSEADRETFQQLEGELEGLRSSRNAADIRAEKLGQKLERAWDDVLRLSRHVKTLEHMLAVARADAETNERALGHMRTAATAAAAAAAAASPPSSLSISGVVGNHVALLSQSLSGSAFPSHAFAHPYSPFTSQLSPPGKPPQAVAPYPEDGAAYPLEELAAPAATYSKQANVSASGQSSSSSLSSSTLPSTSSTSSSTSSSDAVPVVSGRRHARYRPDLNPSVNPISGQPIHSITSLNTSQTTPLQQKQQQQEQPPPPPPQQQQQQQQHQQQQQQKQQQQHQHQHQRNGSNSQTSAMTVLPTSSTAGTSSAISDPSNRTNPADSRTMALALASSLPPRVPLSPRSATLVEDYLAQVDATAALSQGLPPSVRQLDPMPHPHAPLPPHFQDSPRYEPPSQAPFHMQYLNPDDQVRNRAEQSEHFFTGGHGSSSNESYYHDYEKHLSNNLAPPNLPPAPTTRPPPPPSHTLVPSAVSAYPSHHSHHQAARSTDDANYGGSRTSSSSSSLSSPSISQPSQPSPASQPLHQDGAHQHMYGRMPTAPRGPHPVRDAIGNLPASTALASGMGSAAYPPTYPSGHAWRHESDGPTVQGTYGQQGQVQDQMRVQVREPVYGVDANTTASTSDYSMQSIPALESRLIVLCKEQSRVNEDLIRVGDKASRSIAERERKAKLELSATQLTKEISQVRLALKRLGAV